MYWNEFLTVVVVHLLAVASPGPDFAVVLRNSITIGRKAAIYTSLGVGCAIFLHVLYSVLGIGLVITRSDLLFSLLKLFGAGYLIKLGIGALRAKPLNGELTDCSSRLAPRSHQRAFVEGFLTNGMNPKVLLFFLSLFSVVISPSTPMMVQFGYGLYLMLATALWFIFISWLFSAEQIRQHFLKIGHWFDRGMGVVLLVLGIRLLLSSQI